MKSTYFYPAPSEDQQMILDLVVGFAKDELTSLAEGIDHQGEIPQALQEQMAEMGLLAIPISEDNGGAGFDFTSYVLSLAEIAKASGTVAMHLANQTTFFLEPLAQFATGHRAFDEVASGGALGALALLEDAGSFAAEGIQTAVDGLKLSGQKSGVLGGEDAKWILVGAKEGDGISFFAFEKDRAGTHLSETSKRLGFRSLSSSTVTFEGVSLRDEDRVGQAGEGAAILAYLQTRGQVALTAIAAGIADAAGEAAAQYATERKQFRRAISEFEAIKQRLASSVLAHGASMSLLLSCSRMIDDGIPCDQLARVAKVTATSGAVEATDDALQVYGGYGFSQEYPAERFYRDACCLGVFLGGNDDSIQELAKTILPQ